MPLSLPNRTLDWVAYDPASRVVTTALGIPEPAVSGSVRRRSTAVT